MNLNLDWQLYAFAAVNLIGLAGLYFGLKADNAKTRADFAIAILTERTSRESGHLTLKADLMDLIHAVEREVKDLTLRINRIETGSDEWTKALRQRTHDLGNDLHKLVLKVALLEQSNTKKQEQP